MKTKSNSVGGKSFRAISKMTEAERVEWAKDELQRMENRRWLATRALSSAKREAADDVAVYGSEMPERKRVYHGEQIARAEARFAKLQAERDVLIALAYPKAEVAS